MRERVCERESACVCERDLRCARLGREGRGDAGPRAEQRDCCDPGTAYHPTALATVGPYALPVPGFVPGSGSVSPAVCPAGAGAQGRRRAARGAARLRRSAALTTWGMRFGFSRTNGKTVSRSYDSQSVGKTVTRSCDRRQRRRSSRGAASLLRSALLTT